MDDIDTDEFCRDLAAIAAKQLRKLPKEQWQSAMYRLMDCTSLYSPYTYEALKVALGGEPDPVVKTIRDKMEL